LVYSVAPFYSHASFF